MSVCDAENAVGAFFPVFQEFSEAVAITSCIFNEERRFFRHQFPHCFKVAFIAQADIIEFAFMSHARDPAAAGVVKTADRFTRSLTVIRGEAGTVRNCRPAVDRGDLKLQCESAAVVEICRMENYPRDPLFHEHFQRRRCIVFKRIDLYREVVFCGGPADAVEDIVKIIGRKPGGRDKRNHIGITAPD